MFLFNEWFISKPSSLVKCSVPFDSMFTSSFFISLSVLNNSVLINEGWPVLI